MAIRESLRALDSRSITGASIDSRVLEAPLWGMPYTNELIFPQFQNRLDCGGMVNMLYPLCITVTYGINEKLAILAKTSQEGDFNHI